uniref:Transposon Ty3-I Gag-Pol polyprotein n=1 Tax=Cajanus cajan TaxID=3821 RepID=A0A151QNA5_CAJCA|nr:hypothetical protein KK1_047769 [Cajanus cajan]
MKELLTKKRKLSEDETVELESGCSAIIQRSLLQKSRDPGNLTLPVTISNLSLADRSVKYPHGIVEDLLVKVDKFLVPVDFVVMDMEEDSEIPLILGQPFMKTAKVIIEMLMMENSRLGCNMMR